MKNIPTIEEEENIMLFRLYRFSEDTGNNNIFSKIAFYYNFKKINTPSP